jgi:hypothetical protein
MNNYSNYNYDTAYVRPPRKVKHVHFIIRRDLANLENDVNAFADNYPDRKILGIKLTVTDKGYVATITYLEDSKFADMNDSDDENYDDSEDGYEEV